MMGVVVNSLKCAVPRADYHHEQFNSNFGLLGWLDRLHGTDTQYRAWCAAGRPRKPE